VECGFKVSGGGGGEEGGGGGGGGGGAHAVDLVQNHTSDAHAERRPPRKIELHSWRDELVMGAFTSEALDAPARWQPVSRRRFRGKGWHIDVGPGFPNVHYLYITCTLFIH